ncbi:MAG: ribonuclease HIII [Candidatus Altiarchaeota archaeon]|nr:ribonuclease HIII [Candidatus Altiarchaeota archaeon]
MSCGCVGVDESGKGDFFGPLVAAGVYASSEGGDELVSLGVRDSKKLSDLRVCSLGKLIRDSFAYDVVVVNPPRYNELYSGMKNLNRLLAWAHCRVIENLLLRVDCSLVIADQFGDSYFIEDALMSEGRGIRLVQRPKAEDNPAVAAASILARDSFLKGLSRLSDLYGVNLPKGSSKRAVEAGRLFVELYGMGRLGEVAKLHFRVLGKL